MSKRLICIDGKFYKFDNYKFRKLISENQEYGPEVRIKKLVNELGLETQESTIKNLYYKNNGTQDLQLLTKITNYYNVPVYSILIETDFVWECFEDAQKCSRERTLAASKEILRRNFLISPAMEDEYSPQNKFSDFIKQFPRNTPLYFLFLLAALWSLTLDYPTFQKVSNIMMLIILEFLGLIARPYLKKNIFYIVVKIVKYTLEFFIVLGFLRDMFVYYFK